MHWHAYTWAGNGAERGNEATRRPTSPRLTFHDLLLATEWMATQYALFKGTLLHAERIRLNDRLSYATDLLPRGVDVQWGDWLTGGRFATVGMICCPSRYVGRRCPIR